MKIELEQNDLDLIAQAVLQKIAPLIKSLKQDEYGVIPNMMSIDETSHYLGVQRSWVKKKIHYEEMPYYKVGKYVRFRKSELDKWLASRKFTPIATI